MFYQSVLEGTFYACLAITGCDVDLLILNAGLLVPLLTPCHAQQ